MTPFVLTPSIWIRNNSPLKKERKRKILREPREAADLNCYNKREVDESSIETEQNENRNGEKGEVHSVKMKESLESFFAERNLLWFTVGDFFNQPSQSA